MMDKVSIQICCKIPFQPHSVVGTQSVNTQKVLRKYQTLWFGLWKNIGQINPKNHPKVQDYPSIPRRLSRIMGMENKRRNG